MDPRAIVSFGLWPTIIGELNARVLSFGYLGSFEAPTVGALARVKRWLHIRRGLKVK